MCAMIEKLRIRPGCTIRPTLWAERRLRKRSRPDARMSALTNRDAARFEGRMRVTPLLTATVVALATPALATFPFPAPPPGTPPQDYATYLRLPATVPPTRPNDFTGGTAWKLGSDQSGDPTIDASPRELFGVTGMSVDL